MMGLNTKGSPPGGIDSQTHPDHHRVFDAGNQLDETGAFATSISLLEGPAASGPESFASLLFELD
jgi:hypothetical protein